MRVVDLLTYGALVVTLTACGGASGSSGPSPSATDLPAGAQTSAGPPPSPGGGTDAIGGSVSKDVTKKPSIVVPKAAAPTRLTTKDIVVGHGQVAGEASTVSAQLVGVHWANGKTFYSSWDKVGSAPDTFSLTGVILGFAKGVAGMRVGGRREIVIPPTLAYGSKGSGQVGPNETLLFVVDLVKVS
jgi:peptidylprolyl isomerase